MTKNKDLVYCVATEEYLNEYASYTVENLVETFNRLITQAEELGYTDCKVQINSSIEPYEDLPGSPLVQIVGFRPKTLREFEEEENEKRVKELAKEKGITPYEARQYLALKKKGVIS